MWNFLVRRASAVRHCLSTHTSRRFIRGQAGGDLASMVEKCSAGGDLPVVEVANPYEREKPKCVLCRYKVDVDYRNARLLSQFISSFTGRLYEKHVVGLCEHQYNRVRTAIALSRRAGFMPVFLKNPKFLKDPRLFDPMRPIRPNPF